jgi:hypothetical protein
LIKPAFLVVVNIVEQTVARIIDPYIPSSDSDPALMEIAERLPSDFAGVHFGHFDNFMHTYVLRKDSNAQPSAGLVLPGDPGDQRYSGELIVVDLGCSAYGRRSPAVAFAVSNTFFVERSIGNSTSVAIFSQFDAHTLGGTRYTVGKGGTSGGGASGGASIAIPAA